MLKILFYMHSDSRKYLNACEDSWMYYECCIEHFEVVLYCEKHDCLDFIDKL